MDQRSRSFGKKRLDRVSGSARSGWLDAFALQSRTVMIAGVLLSASSSLAAAETRALTVYHTHTQERATIIFKRDGVYDQAGLQELNRIMRDWRRNETIKMDPALYDLIYEVYRDTGASNGIQVVCGYRAPATNNMLRSRSRGVAKFSQHTLGKAMDFFLPGVSLEKLREVGIRKQVGGVGFYPSSGSPFVHLDTGSVRAWPRMTHDQLARIFPDGKTMHLPADGAPLPRYQEAVAENQRKQSGKTQIAGIGTREDNGSIVRPAAKGNILASMFGIKSNDDEDEDAVQAPVKPGAKVTVAEATPKTPLPVPAFKPVVSPNLPRLAPQPVEAEVASLPMPTAKPTIAGPGPAVSISQAPVTLASLPQPPAPVPNRAPGAILPTGWTQGPQSVPQAPKAALKPLDVPVPADKPQLVAGVPRAKPAILASAEARPMDEAFSALTGNPRDPGSNAVLGYAPVANDEARPASTVARDRTLGARVASLAPTDTGAVVATDATRMARTMMPVAPKAAIKADRGDPLARLVSRITDRVEPRMLEPSSSQRAPAMVELHHPDQDSLPQMITKPTLMLADGFASGPLVLKTDRFTGPAVVALAVVKAP